MAIHTAFREIELFAALSESELLGLSNIAIVKRFESGESLFDEGEPCKGLWIVADGMVKIVKMTPSGRQIMLALQHSPCTIAEVPVFDGGPYPATVMAVEQTTGILILKSDFLNACRRNPDLSVRFLAAFGMRLRHLISLVERITFGSIRQRLAQELLTFSDTAGGGRFLMPETHEELANRMGTVREVVSRNLGRFQSEGMIRVQRREVEILDRSALTAEANTEL